MLGILWKDLKVMRMQTAILTSIFLMMTVASVWNTGRQDDISFFLNFSTLMPIFFTLLPCSALALEQQDEAELLEQVHAIKGLTGTLGITGLFEQSAAIVALLRAGTREELQEKMTSLKQEWDRVCETIRQA